MTAASIKAPLTPATSSSGATASGSLPVASIASPRERILDTALALFYAEGLRVGIDRIIAEAGVAKASFYRHFPAKDDLVQAFLEARHEHWMAWFATRVDALCATRPPSLALAATVLEEWFVEPGFRGCAFINAMAEGGLPARSVGVVQRHKAELLAYLRTLATRSEAPHPAQSAEEALLIIEGSIVRAHMTGDPSVARTAARMLARLDGNAPR
jgi:AcrR family transcriptional regulator